MKIPVWTERDFEAQKSWTQFIERITETGLLFTLDQWQTILATNITSKTTLLERVTQIIEMKPYIGINDVGLIVMYAGNDVNVINTMNGVTWMTKVTLGTYENADDPKVNGVTVTRWGTTKILTTAITQIFREFFGIATDDLRNVKLMGYERNTLVTEAYYLYSCGTTTVTPLPEDTTSLQDFKFVRGNNPNAVEAYDETGRPHLGVLKLSSNNKPHIEVIYEAVTTPGTPTNRTAL